jgi:hypothetical protein
VGVQVGVIVPWDGQLLWQVAQHAGAVDLKPAGVHGVPDLRHDSGDLGEHLVVGQVHESREIVLPDVNGVDGPLEPREVDRRLLVEVDELYATHPLVEKLVELHVQ